MRSNRASVYLAIDGERDYQDSLRKSGRFTEEILPIAGEILSIETYVAKLRDAYVDNPGETPKECLHIMRKIAGMCVRAMEHHGAHQR